ncbi:MAG TPA: VOC family protein [Chloroflexota bacterium]|nr:VOC family protein [Chloroflexota bacterium]
MIKIEKVGRVGLSVNDLSKSAAFYSDDWGLAVTEEADDTIYLRTVAAEHHSVSLTAGQQGGLLEVGLQVAGADALDRAAEELAAAGAPILKAPGPADRPGVKRNLRLRDPDGHSLELYWGDEAVTEDYGNRNVKPEGLTHVVLRTVDIDRAQAFYREHFGFKESDWNGHHMVFLRCNEIHHQLAFVHAETPGLHHVAFEVRDFLEIAKGVYYLGEKGVPRLWGPGRHGAGNNLFSYFWDPEQNVVEYTTDIIRIYDDAAWKVTIWPGRDTVDLWKQGPPPVLR